MSTKSGSPGSGPAEGSQELLLTKPPPDGGLVLEQHGERSVSVPSLRVVEIDVDEMDKHTKAMIRRNNFYGVSGHLQSDVDAPRALLPPPRRSRLSLIPCNAKLNLGLSDTRGSELFCTARVGCCRKSCWFRC